MKPKNIIWIIAALALVVVASLALRPGTKTGVTSVDAGRVASLAAAGERVIDVRSQGEYEAGHIPGAENVPLDQLQTAMQSWDKTQPLVVYCATGARSAQAVSILQSAGFGTIHHFAEGMVAWTGDTEGGAGSSARQPPTQKPTATPVMYEFYTDW
jgi:rhodanese-related sulfurtransferase